MEAHNAISHITDDDIYLFNEGSHFRLYEKLGARLVKQDGNAGTYFAVWAPNADFVSVIGEFNEGVLPMIFDSFYIPHDQFYGFLPVWSQDFRSGTELTIMRASTRGLDRNAVVPAFI